MRTTAAQRALASSVRRSAAALTERAAATREPALTANQLSVLADVGRHGPAAPREVAARLGMVPQSLTRPLAAVEAAGLVARSPDPGDRRAARLTLTAAGARALRDDSVPQDTWVARAVAAVCTDDERAVLERAADVLARVAAWPG